jgi:uncharacterized membrane protein
MVFTVLFVIPFIVGLLIGAALFVLIIGLGTLTALPLAVAKWVQAGRQGWQQGRAVRQERAPLARERIARNMDLNRRIIRHPFSRALWAEAWANLKDDLGGRPA